MPVMAIRSMAKKLLQTIQLNLVPISYEACGNKIVITYLHASLTLCYMPH